MEQRKTERVSLTLTVEDKDWLMSNVENISSWARQKIQDDRNNKTFTNELNGFSKRLIFGQAVIYLVLGTVMMLIASTYLSANNLSSLFLMVTGGFVAIYGVVTLLDYKKLRRNV